MVMMDWIMRVIVKTKEAIGLLMAWINVVYVVEMEQVVNNFVKNSLIVMAIVQKIA